NQWARWREEEFTDAQLSAWARRPACASSGSPAAPPSPQAGRRTRRGQASEQDRLLAALLHPQRLLALVRQFILFDRRSGKLIARCQQFFGVRALMARLGSRRFDGSREGGVVWHTTGSGKSLTMV